MIILLDFDGTCVADEFPNIGKDIGSVPVLKEIINKGHKLILFTMRSHGINKKGVFCGGYESKDYLTPALEWFEKHGIELYGIQKHPTQEKWTSSPKAHGDICIDDRNLGVPLIYEENMKPYVDWKEIRNQLKERNII